MPELTDEELLAMRERCDRAVNQERLADAALVRAGIPMADAAGAQLSICEGIEMLAAQRDRAVQLLTLEESKRWSETARADKASDELEGLLTKIANGTT